MTAIAEQVMLQKENDGLFIDDLIRAVASARDGVTIVEGAVDEHPAVTAIRKRFAALHAAVEAFQSDAIRWHARAGEYAAVLGRADEIGANLRAKLHHARFLAKGWRRLAVERIGAHEECEYARYKESEKSEDALFDERARGERFEAKYRRLREVAEMVAAHEGGFEEDDGCLDALRAVLKAEPSVEDARTRAYADLFIEMHGGVPKDGDGGTK